MTVRVLGIGLSWMAGIASVPGVHSSYFSSISDVYMPGGSCYARIPELAKKKLGISVDYLIRAKGGSCVVAPGTWHGNAVTAANSWDVTGDNLAPALAAAAGAGCDRAELLIGGQDGAYDVTEAEYTPYMNALIDALIVAGMKKIIYHTGACVSDGLNTYPTEIRSAWTNICAAYEAAYPGLFLTGADLYANMALKGTNAARGPLMNDDRHCTTIGLGWMARQLFRRNVQTGFYTG